MQALMLAAGMGKRLGRLTANAPKCMVRVNGKTLIEYAIDALIANGITSLTLVVGYEAATLKAFLADRYPAATSGIALEYIDNAEYSTTNNIYSLYLAREVLCRDETILMESDCIFCPDILTRLINCDSANVAVVSHFEAWMDGTCVLLDGDMRDLTGGG